MHCHQLSAGSNFDERFRYMRGNIQGISLASQLLSSFDRVFTVLCLGASFWWASLLIQLSNRVKFEFFNTASRAGSTDWLAELGQQPELGQQTGSLLHNFHIFTICQNCPEKCQQFFQRQYILLFSYFAIIFNGLAKTNHIYKLHNILSSTSITTTTTTKKSELTSLIFARIRLRNV